ncbi:glutamyl-tRNA(Gln) amidotransferase subunit C, mitochondrial [Phlebotomus argentipes]|uniref:glutamyl-tRNA(Gln) amidotransferase subunit C, mitochondrial n=1 Tax=Phlebotomus argentipes TaxID=94469 RepID=UPI002893805D|nr:glutamyl-tRNA(Gln) amidotransferase subunit C, mitochondrial [Phlebotomus argentipes]
MLASRGRVFQFWSIVRRYSVKSSDKRVPEVSTKISATAQTAPGSEKSVRKVSIDEDTIHLLERLSLVNIESKEALRVVEDSIAFADKILDINTEGVEPLYTVLEDCDLELREDKVTDGNIREEVLKNASVTEEEYFVAPPGNIPLEKEKKSFT